MLEINALTVKKHGKAILKNISLQVRKGRVTVILGKNGSGKTTLLESVIGIQKYKGSIMLSGREISTFSMRERAKFVSFLPQRLPESSLSVRTLVSLGRNPYVGGMGILAQSDKEAVKDAIASAGIEDFAERRVSTLSGGERKKAFIAMLLAQKTPLIMLDEAGSDLDPEATKELSELLLRLVRDGMTVLAVMHDLNEAVRIADDIAILSSGELVCYGEKKALLDVGAIEKSFGVRKLCIEDSGETRTFFI